MRWQYRTILFEFQKDGLLGDRYLDDEEIDKTLNRQGRNGWELVNVALLQEGLLAFLKRPAGEGVATAAAEEHRPARPQPQPAETGHPVSAGEEDSGGTTAEELQQREREHIRQLEEQRRQAMREREKDLVGEIRIS
ncbi:MAG TPA: DUF4177 domain-containing protein [Desulfobulbus sp.]|nr:DUF4177 domain-containing protein [Desulfobulbus sp.]